MIVMMMMVLEVINIGLITEDAEKSERFLSG